MPGAPGEPDVSLSIVTKFDRHESQSDHRRVLTVLRFLGT